MTLRNHVDTQSHRILILVSTTALLIGVIFGYLLNANYRNDYVNKPKLCQDFAQKYLNVASTKEKAHPNSNLPNERIKWEMAVDIETDFYNLCMLNLDSGSLQKYKSSVMSKYQPLKQ